MVTSPRPLLASLVLAVAGLSVSCILFTGGSNGYSAAEGGAPSQSCSSSSDCAGLVCCYEVDGGALQAVCAASCPASYESCTQAADCGDGGSCLAQSCSATVDGFKVSFSVTTCGVVPICVQ
jgi:hypothetical protein